MASDVQISEGRLVGPDGQLDPDAIGATGGSAFIYNGSSYVEDTDHRFFIGTVDPDGVAAEFQVGDTWIDTSTTLDLDSHLRFEHGQVRDTFTKTGAIGTTEWGARAWSATSGTVFTCDGTTAGKPDAGYGVTGFQPMHFYGIVEAEIATAGAECYVIVRHDAGGGGIRIGRGTGSATYVVQNASTGLAIANLGTPKTTVPNMADGDKITVFCSESDGLDIYVNEVLIWSAFDTAINWPTATGTNKVALAANGTTPRFASIKATPVRV